MSKRNIFQTIRIKIIIFLLKQHRKVVIIIIKELENDIVKVAYQNALKNYKDSIMFLEAELGK